MSDPVLWTEEEIVENLRRAELCVDVTLPRDLYIGLLFTARQRLKERQKLALWDELMASLEELERGCIAPADCKRMELLTKAKELG